MKSGGNSYASSKIDPGLTDRVERLGRSVSQAEYEDVVVDEGRKLKLRSPNGTYWSIQVSDTGALTCTNEGPSL